MPARVLITLIAIVLVAALVTTLLAALVMPAGVGLQALLVVTVSASAGLYVLRRRRPDGR